MKNSDILSRHASSLDDRIRNLIDDEKLDLWERITSADDGTSTHEDEKGNNDAAEMLVDVVHSDGSPICQVPFTVEKLLRYAKQGKDCKETAAVSPASEKHAHDRRHKKPRRLKRCGSISLELSGLKQTVTCSCNTFVRDYVPVAQWLLLTFLRGVASRENQRHLVGVAGPAGAGKSFLSKFLLKLINEMWSMCCEMVLNERPSVDICVVLGMDAYHFTNSVLESRSVPAEFKHQLPVDTAEGTLKDIKGSEPSIDAERLHQDLSRILNSAEVISLPEYDRNLHDPVDGKIHVDPDNKIVIIEGLYLLHGCRSTNFSFADETCRWSRISNDLDSCIFLDISEGESRHRVVERKVKSGLTEEQATERYDRNDLRILRRVHQGKSGADILLEYSSDTDETVSKLVGCTCQVDAYRQRQK